jgi:hypothetical protein
MWSCILGKDQSFQRIIYLLNNPLGFHFSVFLNNLSRRLYPAMALKKNERIYTPGINIPYRTISLCFGEVNG